MTAKREVCPQCKGKDDEKCGCVTWFYNLKQLAMGAPQATTERLETMDDGVKFVLGFLIGLVMATGFGIYRVNVAIYEGRLVPASQCLPAPPEAK